MIRRYLSNPWQTAAFATLTIASVATPWAAAAAAVLFCACEIAAGRDEGPRWWPREWPPVDRRLDVLYDGECGLCARAKARLESWPTAAAFRFVPLQSSGARALVPDLTEEQYRGAMHVIDGGRVVSGADGWKLLMQFGPVWLAWIAGAAPGWLARPVYAFIARHRYRWFGRVECAETCGFSASARRPSSPPSGSPGPS